MKYSQVRKETSISAYRTLLYENTNLYVYIYTSTPGSIVMPPSSDPGKAKYSNQTIPNSFSVCNQPTRSTQPCIPSGSLNRLSA